MSIFAFVAASLGLLLLLWRMLPRHAATAMRVPREGKTPRVSIIVPARNEEAVLGRLLASLQALDYPKEALEVIVVDDRSEDGTAAIAREYGVRLVSGEPRPDGWMGKQWACHQGALVASGDYLLFTDADTLHYPASLRTAMAAITSEGAHGLTVLPYHESRDLWEKLCGPFHVWLLAATNPYGKPRPGQVYAIGQYLCFERAFYEKMGGHTRVKTCWVEDIPLAKALLEDGGKWSVWTGAPLFEVRMYPELMDFIRGWRRNFRAGMSYSYPGTGLEMTLFMAAILGGGELLRGSLLPWLFTGLSCALLAVFQQRLGRFSLLGVIFFPFSLLLFCWISCLALYDLLLKRPLLWKNRSYGVPAAR